MREFRYCEKPIEVCGVPFFAETGRLERLPQSLREKLPNLDFLGRRCPGARLRFRTDSKNLEIKIAFETLTVDIGMAIYACQSADVYIGSYGATRYAGHVFPESYDVRIARGHFTKSAEVEDVTIWLPRNETIGDVSIGIDDGAVLLPPTPYRHPLPILYYGSSITEGGCCSKVSNGYNALISRWLDVEYYNFGFSANARGELEMAEYINTIDKSIFVMDYDHNAPTVEHLKQTHEPFFQRIRQASPTLPIVMLTRPPFYDPETRERRNVVYQTYQNAVAAGDQNVYFIDGASFFPAGEVDLCSNDNCHPNDLGFYRMAKVIAPVIEKLLSV